MRRLIALVLILSAFAASAQMSIGMRNTRFVNIAYAFYSGLFCKFEQSIYSEKPKYQCGRLYVGYHSSVKGFEYSAEAFYGMSYCNLYRNMGIIGSANRNIYGRLGAYAAINPYYDSGFDFKLCFRGGMSLAIAESVSIIADYSDIPVYRQSEPALRAGLWFKTSKFSFSPLLSVPLESHDKLKEVRVLTNFNWNF